MERKTSLKTRSIVFKAFHPESTFVIPKFLKFGIWFSFRHPERDGFVIEGVLQGNYSVRFSGWKKLFIEGCFYFNCSVNHEVEELQMKIVGRSDIHVFSHGEHNRRPQGSRIPDTQLDIVTREFIAERRRDFQDFVSKLPAVQEKSSKRYSTEDNKRRRAGMQYDSKGKLFVQYENFPLYPG